MKTIRNFLVVVVLLSCNVLFAQTHVTVNDEKCWIFKTITDQFGTTCYVVVVESGEIENEKQIVEKILQYKDKNKAEFQLRNQGFRLEIFEKEDITPLKLKK